MGWITGLIGGIGGVVNGVIGSHAAHAAAKTQQEAAAAQQKALMEELNSNKQWVSGATAAAQRGVAETTQAAQGAVDAGKNQANQSLETAYNAQKTNLNPYMEAGQQGIKSMAEMFAPGGSMTERFKAPTGAEVEATPGYQFQLEQGQKALQRSAAARGFLQSGATMKALDKYSQDTASTGYEKAYNRAFNEFQTHRQNTIGGAMALSNFGQNATGMANSAAQNWGNQTSANTSRAAEVGAGYGARGGEFIANAGMQGAEFNAAQGNQMTLQGLKLYQNGVDARAAGQLGSANAWMGAVNGVTGGATQAAGGWRGGPSGDPGANIPGGVQSAFPNGPLSMTPYSMPNFTPPSYAPSYAPPPVQFQDWRLPSYGEQRG